MVAGHDLACPFSIPSPLLSLVHTIPSPPTIRADPCCGPSCGRHSPIGEFGEGKELNWWRHLLMRSISSGNVVMQGICTCFQGKGLERVERKMLFRKYFWRILLSRVTRANGKVFFFLILGAGKILALYFICKGMYSRIYFGF